MTEHKPLTAAEIEDDKCPHNCPNLGKYAADGHGSWPCRALGRGLLDTYDMGATGGPNEPFRPNDCPRILSMLQPAPDHIADSRKMVPGALPENCTEAAQIAHLVSQGHPEHCAQRQVWGDGECECADVTAGYNPEAWKRAKSAPLPEGDGKICARLADACTGHPHALIPWPHRLLHDAVAHISDLTRRLAEELAAKDVEIATAQAELAESRNYVPLEIARLEAELKDANDSLTIAYLSGAADWKAKAKALEAERDALREALTRMVAIGYTHENGCHPSENRHTDGCQEKQATLAQAKAALAATEAKP